MKQRNKRTGEIGELQITEKHCAVAVGNGTASCGIEIYSSLAEFNSEWEDYEEPKVYWYIDYDGGILCGESDNSSAERMMISMGNHFETIKEAEQAVEKLKAWKRLKDKGFKFDGWTSDYGKLKAWFKFDKEAWLTETEPDLDLLFGGEE